MEPVNLKQKFGLFRDYWSPKIVGELNESYVKVVKLKGEFVWHHHEAEEDAQDTTGGDQGACRGRPMVSLSRGDAVVHE